MESGGAELSDEHTADYQYANLLRMCLCGDRVQTRNSVCLRVTGLRCVFEDTPLVTARKTPWKTSLREWEWFMSGSNWVGNLHESVRPWWEPWANDIGEVPNNYSGQFRSAQGAYWDEARNNLCMVSVDQIEAVIGGIRDHPYSRRNVLTTWNAAEMWHPSTPITNCHHTCTQFFVTDNRLDMITYQRSADAVVGLPSNWIQTWAFLLWLAHRTGRTPGRLTWIGGDVHVYESHLDLARRITEVGPPTHLPQLVYTPTTEAFRADDFALSEEYRPVILEKAEMVV